jgi:tetratricopeptide (TPR) repeat protein
MTYGPGDFSPGQRQELFQRLTGLPVAQFEQVLFALRPPQGLVPASAAPQGERVSALLGWAEGTGGHGLAAVHRALAAVLGEAPPPLRLWLVPSARNRAFTGREAVLTGLHALLAGHGAAGLTQALAGLGGVGKSQTALEYAYRYAAEYQAVFWVGAESEATLTAGCGAIAARLELPESGAAEAAVVREAVKAWLSREGGYLLILDNADDPAIVAPFLPENPRGHLLLTSRSPDPRWLQGAPPLVLGVMEPEEALQFLFQRSARTDDDPAEHAAAAALAAALGHLPLALEQAGAFIAEYGSRFVDYLAEYERLRLALLDEQGPGTGAYPDTVRTTWQRSFAAVRAASPAAAELLQASAFFAPDQIPEELLLAGAAELGEAVAGALSGPKAGPLSLDRLLRPLVQHSLVRRSPAQRTYEVHRLVQEVVRDALPEPEQRVWSERAVAALARAYPGQEFADWPACERWLPHAQAGAAGIERSSLVSRDAGALLNQAGSYLRARARYREAEPLLARSAALIEQTSGPGDPDTAASLNNLALLHKVQGKLREAEPLYQRALAIRKQALGPQHPDTAESLNNLAGLYHAQGKLAEAEALFQQALAIDEAAYGGEHPVVASDLNNLAALYRDQGKLAEAEPLYQQALAIREQALGPAHPDTAQSLSNLAAIYQDRGKLAEAEDLLGRATAIREAALGRGHPDTAQSINNLASLYQAQGRLAEAEPLYREALAIREQVLGSMHFDTAGSLNNLAGIYYLQGKLAEAEPLFQRTLTIYEQALGPMHPHTATSLNNLAMLYQNQGKLGEAEPLHRRALSIREQALGPLHPDTAISLNNLALLYRAQGKLAEAEPLLQRALAILEAAAPDHPNTATCRQILDLVRAEREEP